MKKLSKVEAVCWSIAFPGFPQLLSGYYIKGLLLLGLEFLVNVNSRFNEAIALSFYGEMSQASAVLDYQWLLFYPCIYWYSIWDAYRFAEGEVKKYDFLPFVIAAYFLTVGTIYGPKVKLFGIFFGPVFFPMIITIFGFVFGIILKNFFMKIGFK